MASLRFPLALLAAITLAACAGGSTGLQSPEADLARRIMAEDCLVGDYMTGNSVMPISVRVGKVNKATTLPYLVHKASMSTAPIHVHSIKDLGDGWLEVDASGSGTRENFYYNAATAEFACSLEEWRSVLNDPRQKAYFERSPLIQTPMDRLN